MLSIFLLRSTSEMINRKSRSWFPKSIWLDRTIFCLRAIVPRTVVNAFLSKAGQSASREQIRRAKRLSAKPQRAAQLRHERGKRRGYGSCAYGERCLSAAGRNYRPGCSRFFFEKAKQIQDEAFQNQSVPVGLSNEGLTIFIRGSKKSSYKFHVDVTNFSETDGMDFTFEEFIIPRKLINDDKEIKHFAWP